MRDARDRSDVRTGARRRPSLRGAAVAAGFLASLLAAPGGAAAQAGAPPVFPPGDTLELGEIVVTAHRLPVPRDALTSSVTVISSEEIEAAGEEHVLELLRSVVGGHVAQTGSWGGVASLFLRGGESNYVKVLVDGVPVNRPGGDVDLSALSASDVERIEIVRGPASVVYGSDAVTGVVQIFTRRGRGEPEVEARVRGGTYGTLGWSARMGGSGERVDYSFSLSRFTTDGIRPFNDGFANTVASGRVHIAPDARTEADVSVRYGDHRSHFPTNAKGEAVDENQFTFGDRLTAGVEVTRWLTDRLEARLQLGLNELDTGFDDAADGPADTTGTFASESQEDIVRRTVGARANYHLGPATVLTAGAEVEDQELRGFSRSESGFGGFSSTLAGDRRNVGVYAQALAAPLDGLSLAVGSRLDDNERFGTVDTWRAGAAYRLPGAVRLRVAFGTAFKEPTFFENFAEGFVRGNPDLEPERSRSWEVGASRDLLEGRLELEATAYDQRFDDLIQFVSSPPDPGGPNFLNVPEARARGIEATASAAIVPGLRVSADYAHVETEVTDAGFASGSDAALVEGEPLLRRPAHAGGIRATWRPSANDVLSLEVRHVGARDDLDFGGCPSDFCPPTRVELPAHTRIDASARIGLPLAGRALRRAALTLRVDNLLDEGYAEIANFPARGRTILAGVEASAGF